MASGPHQDSNLREGQEHAEREQKSNSDIHDEHDSSHRLSRYVLVAAERFDGLAIAPTAVMQAGTDGSVGVWLTRCVLR